MRRPLDVVSLGECMVEFSDLGRGRFSRSYGGDALNTAVAASRLGLRCGFVSDVGDDPFRAFLLASWRRESVRHFGETVGRPNGIYFILRGDPRKPRFHYYRRGSAAAATLREGRFGKIRAYAERAQFFHFTGVTAATTERPDLLRRLAARLHGRVRVSFDTNYRSRLWGAGRAREAVGALLPHVDLLFTSLEDEGQLHPGMGEEAVLRHYLRRGPSTVVLKRGARGCVLASGGSRAAVPALPARVVDTTGAGDALNAGVLAGLRRGLPLGECGLLGVVAAGLKVRSRGAVGPSLRGEEAERLFRGLKGSGWGSVGGRPTSRPPGSPAPPSGRPRATGR